MKNDNKDNVRDEKKEQRKVVPLHIQLSDSDEEKSDLISALKQQLDKQRQRLNQAAEEQFRDSGSLDSPRVREEVKRFNAMEARFIEEDALYERQRADTQPKEPATDDDDEIE